ncbi:MAG: hypothetical protein JNM27_23190 [Leptospirales bacterium]|nr:hypothetical protein [Leptospirales bacterium]
MTWNRSLFKLGREAMLSVETGPETRMKEYERVYSALKTPEIGLQIIEGKIKLPSYDTSQPAKKEYGFPPAFIPWWSSSSIPHYFGYWMHFFSSSRKLTFAQLNTNIGLGGPHHALEIARTFAQFFSALSLRTFAYSRNWAKKLKSSHVPPGSTRQNSF